MREGQKTIQGRLSQKRKQKKMDKSLIETHTFIMLYLRVIDVGWVVKDREIDRTTLPPPLPSFRIVANR